jgi:hypothetical protein
MEARQAQNRTERFRKGGVRKAPKYEPIKQERMAWISERILKHGRLFITRGTTAPVSTLIPISAKS